MEEVRSGQGFRQVQGWLVKTRDKKAMWTVVRVRGGRQVG